MSKFISCLTQAEADQFWAMNEKAIAAENDTWALTKEDHDILHDFSHKIVDECQLEEIASLLPLVNKHTASVFLNNLGFCLLDLFDEKDISDVWYAEAMCHYYHEYLRFCWDKAEHRKRFLSKIPKHRQTESFFVVGSEICPRAFIPACTQHKMTLEMAMSAARSGLLGCIPKRLRTAKVCQIVLEKYLLQKNDMLTTYRFIPDRLFNSTGFWKDVVAQHPTLLRHVPIEYRTKIVCDAAWNALPQSAFDIEADDHDHTGELDNFDCSDFWKNVTGKFLDNDTFVTGLCAIVLAYIPEKHITAKMADVAMRCDPRSFFLLPEHLMTKKRCLQYIANSGYTVDEAYDQIPREKRTFSIEEAEEYNENSSIKTYVFNS